MADTEGHTLSDYLYEMSSRSKCRDRKRVNGCQRLGREYWGVTVFMEWWITIVMVAQLCEYTRNQWIVCFKRMNFIVCELLIISINCYKNSQNWRAIGTYHPMYCSFFLLTSQVTQPGCSVWPWAQMGLQWHLQQQMRPCDCGAALSWTLLGSRSGRPV